MEEPEEIKLNNFRPYNHLQQLAYFMKKEQYKHLIYTSFGNIGGIEMFLEIRTKDELPKETLEMTKKLLKENLFINHVTYKKDE